MESATTRKTIFAALMLGTAIAASGCDQQNSSTAGQKVDRAADKVAATTDKAVGKTAEVVDDTALTAKVKAAILAEPGLRSLQIGVETKDAVVTLTGSVDSSPLKERARQVAAGVSGVRDVVDHLVAKPA